MNLGTRTLRGRPRNRWQDGVREDGRIVGGEGWQEKVCNREEWINESVATQPRMDVIWLIKLGVEESIMGIGSCNLQRCQVRKRWKIGLNQSLIYKHSFPPMTLLFALLQLSSQKTIVRWKKYWRSTPPPHATCFTMQHHLHPL